MWELLKFGWHYTQLSCIIIIFVKCLLWSAAITIMEGRICSGRKLGIWKEYEMVKWIALKRVKLNNFSNLLKLEVPQCSSITVCIKVIRPLLIFTWWDIRICKINIPHAAQRNGTLYEMWRESGLETDKWSESPRGVARTDESGCRCRISSFLLRTAAAASMHISVCNQCASQGLLPL